MSVKLTDLLGDRDMPSNFYLMVETFFSDEWGEKLIFDRRGFFFHVAKEEKLDFPILFKILYKNQVRWGQIFKLKCKSFFVKATGMTSRVTEVKGSG